MTGLGTVGRVDDAHAHLAGDHLQLLLFIGCQNNHFLILTFLFFPPVGSCCLPPEVDGWNLSEGILGGIVQGLGLVVGDVGNAKVLEYLEQRLAAVGEGHGAVVGIPLLDQHMAVEPAHLGDGEDADAAEGAGGNRQNLAFRDVGAQSALTVALEPIEGDLTGSDVAFQSASGEVGSTAVLQQTILDQLIPMMIQNVAYAEWMEATTAEQGSRRVAMKTASDNADNLSEELLLEYNKARQAAITQEITEVVNGSNAV